MACLAFLAFWLSGLRPAAFRRSTASLTASTTATMLPLLRRSVVPASPASGANGKLETQHTVVITPNKKWTYFWHQFSTQFLCSFTWYLSFFPPASMVAKKKADWLLSNFNQSESGFLSYHGEQNGGHLAKEHWKLAWKIFFLPSMVLGWGRWNSRMNLWRDPPARTSGLENQCYFFDKEILHETDKGEVASTRISTKVEVRLLWKLSLSSGVGNQISIRV